MLKPTQQRIIKQLIKKILAVHHVLINREKWINAQLAHLHPNYRYSAKNLLRYLLLRDVDLRDIQAQLTNLGLSSLSHAERQVLANVENILYLLHAQLGEPFKGKYPFGTHPVNYAQSAKKLQENSKRLFGQQLNRTCLMVTLPTEAIDPSYVKMLLQNGMQVARVNCSHDDAEVWLKLVQNVRRVSKEMAKSCSVYIDLSGPKIRTDQWYPADPTKPKEKFLLVHEGDRFLMADEAIVTKPSSLAKLTCSLPEIIEDVQVGHHIWFDDGKVGGVIEEKLDKAIKILVTQAAPEGVKIKKEKGINLPDTRLSLPALTDEDLTNLDFVCQHADIVGYSFVRTPSDVAHLQKELIQRGREEIGVVLKIENREAFTNLPSLILQGMESPNIGIMTARGDLAVELGPERLSEVQEQIMWICEAAMIPCIWATQVLEGLAKKGIASRAEITDAAMSVRAECVILNKGPYIGKAMQTLNDILFRMEQHQYKKQATLGKLKVAEEFWSKQHVQNN